MDLILRRPNLGRTSVRKIIEYADDHEFRWLRSDRPLPNKVRMLFRWGYTGKQDSETTVNTCEAIALCANKWKSRVVMEKEGVSIPKTMGPEPDGQMHMPTELPEGHRPVDFAIQAIHY